MEGIDAVIIGPQDYTQASGFFGKFKGPEYQGDMEKVVEISQKTGKAAGNSGGSPEEVADWMNRGFRIGMIGNEVIFMLKGAKADVNKVKELLK